MVCDVSPLHCADLLLGIPYQQAWHTAYHSKSHQYHLEGHTYVLTSSTIKYTETVIDQDIFNQVNINQCISLCLVHPINLDNQNNHVPPTMVSMLQ